MMFCASCHLQEVPAAGGPVKHSCMAGSSLGRLLSAEHFWHLTTLPTTSGSPQSGNASPQQKMHKGCTCKKQSCNRLEAFRTCSWPLQPAWKPALHA